MKDSTMTKRNRKNSTHETYSTVGDGPVAELTFSSIVGVFEGKSPPTFLWDGVDFAAASNSFWSSCLCGALGRPLSPVSPAKSVSS